MEFSQRRLVPGGTRMSQRTWLEITSLPRLVWFEFVVGMILKVLWAKFWMKFVVIDSILLFLRFLGNLSPQWRSTTATSNATTAATKSATSYANASNSTICQCWPLCGDRFGVVYQRMEEVASRCFPHSFDFLTSRSTSNGTTGNGTVYLFLLYASLSSN